MIRPKIPPYWPNTLKFPVFSLFNREFGRPDPRDGFAADCLHSQPVRVLRVRPAALGRSPEIPRGSRPFARDAAGRVTGRDPLSQGTRPERAIFSVGRFRGHTTPIDGRGIARRCCAVLENQRDCRSVAAVTGYRSAGNGAVDLRLFEAERLSLSRPLEGQSGDLHELGRGEAEGLAPVEDGFGDLGAQKGQPDQPGGNCQSKLA